MAVILVFAVALTYLCQLRLDNFYAGNWDLGINQQMLWTTAHGRLAYETGDSEFAVVHSFLQVHNTFIALPLASLYAAAPAPATLFAIQASVFGASSVPLYLIARRAIASRIIIWGAIALYLSSFVVLSALLFDFHWEAFIPVEFLAFFYFVETRRYAWSLVPLVIGVLTLEVFPYLVGGVAVLMVYQSVSRLGFRWQVLARDREIRIALALILGMAGAALLRDLTATWILTYFVGPFGVTGGVLSPFQLAASWSTLSQAEVYWMLMLAAFAFVPVLAPKYLILTIPWFVESVFLTPAYASDGYGFQYALIAAPTIVVAFVYGLGHVEREVLGRRFGWPLIGGLFASGAIVLLAGITSSRALLSNAPGSDLLVLLVIPVLVVVTLGLIIVVQVRRRPSVPEGMQIPSRWRSPRTTTTLIGGVLVTFVAFNMVMSPLNPSNTGATAGPGYEIQYDSNPMAGQMSWITTMIPAGSDLLASDNLFPYVANNPNAWAVPWYPVSPGNPPFFPFNGSNLPRFVLMDQAQASFLPSGILSALWNPAIYGLVAYVVYQPYPGTVYLFEFGYAGAPVTRSITSQPSAYFFTADNLSLGPAGQIAPDSSSRFGVVVESSNVSVPLYTTECIWYGPYQTFAPGNYALAVNISGGLYPGANDSDPVLMMDSVSIADPGQAFFSIDVYAGELSTTGWTTLLVSFTLDHPFPLVEFRGYQFYFNGAPDGHATLNYLELYRT